MKKYPSAHFFLGLAVLSFSGCVWFTDPPKSGEAKPANAKINAKAIPTAGIKNPAGQTFYVVKADFTPLYRTGPQQPNGPDQSLPKDTLVVLLTKNFGYSRVQIENGLNGYVATEDLALAPAERVNPPKPVELNPSNNSAIVEHYSVEKAARSAATSAGNAEALPELPEPRVEPEPTPIVKPEFRY
jgi:hypothetical protein